MNRKRLEYKPLNQILEAVQDTLIKTESNTPTWLVPRCPKCEGVLSQLALAQNTLVCLKCGARWKLEYDGQD